MNTNQSQKFLWRAVLASCIGILLAMGWLASVWQAKAALDVPQLLSYQGRVTDGSRITVDDASYNMRFAIYSAATGGTCLWSADDTDTNSATIDCPSDAPGGSISVTVTDGIFTVLLGDTTSNAQNALPDALFDDNATLFLGVTIGSDAEMTPRKRITSAAYSLQAGDADLLDSLNTDNDGCTAACVPVTDSNGNLVLTGNPQSTAISGGVLYINPASADANEMLIGVGVGGGTGVFGVDEDGDVTAGSFLANIGSANAAIGSNASLSSTVSLGVSQNYSTATTSRLGNFSSTISGALNAGGIFSGVRSALTVDTGASNDVEKLYGSEAILVFNGGGVSDYAAGYRSAVTSNVGTQTDAYGLDALVSTNGGTITTGYGVRGEVTNTTGTLTTGYGGYFGANGSSTAYAIYAAGGYVHIEGDGTATTPDDAGNNGTLYVRGLIEADDRISIDKVSTSTTAGTEYGGTFDVSDTGNVSSGSDTTYGIDVSTTRTGASGGTFLTYGIRSQVTGGTEGTSTTYGAYISATGSDTNYAVYTASGLFQIDDDSTINSTVWQAFDETGDLYVADDLQVADGALCVGSAAAPCDGATGTTAGTIYAVNTTVQGNDVAEMFASAEVLTAGEIVSVSDAAHEHVERSKKGEVVIGAISTAPGLTLGRQTKADNYFPIALAGRAPVKVNGENGALAIGDRIAVSSTPGVGMKATEKGEVVGIAMEAFGEQGSGVVMTFIQPHFWDGVEKASVTQSVTQTEASPIVQTDAVLSIHNGIISNIFELSSANWNINFDGMFTTLGSYDVGIKSYQNTIVTTHAALGLEHYLMLAGTSDMSGADTLVVEFEEIEPEFNDVVSSEVPILVTATVSNGSGTVYVTDKSNNGFTLHRTSGSGTQVDWIVMGIRRGMEAKEDLEVQLAEEPLDEEAVDETVEEEPIVLDSADEEETDVVIEELIEEAIEEVSPIEDVEDTEIEVQDFDELLEEEPSAETSHDEVEVIAEPVAEAVEPEIEAEDEVVSEPVVEEQTEEAEQVVPVEVVEEEPAAETSAETTPAVEETE